MKRAIITVYKQADNNKRSIYTYGPIIHNEEVVKDLISKGVKVINSKEQLAECRDGIVILRAHGVSKEIYEVLNDNNIEYIDATCPYVLKIHRLVQQYTKQDYYIVIVGNGSHPEVQGIKSWCEGNCSVISTVFEAEQLNTHIQKKICIVSQTTFNNNKFQELVEIIEKKGYDINVLNTICDATFQRQKEAREISSEVDSMIVIGDKNSSNTQKLFEICKKECENTYYIQTFEDLDVSKLQSIESVGITAGASTPNNIIEEVQKNVRNEF